MANVDKINVDKELLSDIISKAWHDIEDIKSQVDMLSNEDYKTNEFKKLLTNLLTNYYVFVGCTENMLTDFDDIKQAIIEPESKETGNAITVPLELHDIGVNKDTQDEFKPDIDNFEPFEYFVDFDEPFGEKITDEDLYKI